MEASALLNLPNLAILVSRKFSFIIKLETFVNILELARKYKVKKLVYASSSSVYGDNTASPSCENHVTDSQISLYGATKKSNELMAYS